MKKTAKTTSFVDQLLEAISLNSFEIEIGLYDDYEPYEPRTLSNELRELIEQEKLTVAHHLERNEYALAACIQEHVWEIADQNLGPLHQETIENLCKLGDCYFGAGNFENSKNIYLKAYRVAFVILGKNDPLTLLTSKGFTQSKAETEKLQTISRLSSHITNMVAGSSEKSKPSTSLKKSISVQLDALRAIRNQLNQKILDEVQQLINDKNFSEAELHLRNTATELMHSSNQKDKERLREVLNLWIETLANLGLTDCAEKTRLLSLKVMAK